METSNRNSELEQHQTSEDVVASQSETSIQIIFREIHKNAWLRRLPIGDRKGVGGAYSKHGENVWVVFCVHDDRDPYLEVYGDQKVAAAHRPDWCAPLSSCLHVTPTICSSPDGHHEFVVTLRTGVVKLAAPTWDLMMEWVSTLRSKLEEMKILTPPENLYSQPPQLPRAPLLPTRDPNSPLPPPPAGPRSLVPGTEMTSQEDNQQHAVAESSSSLATEPTVIDNSANVTSVLVSSTQPLDSPHTPRLPARVPASPQNRVPLSPIIPQTRVPVLQLTPQAPPISPQVRELSQPSSPQTRPAATTSLYITQSDSSESSLAQTETGQNVTVIEVEGPTDSNVFDFSFMGTSLQEASSHYERLYLSENSEIRQVESTAPSSDSTEVTTSSTQTEAPRRTADERPRRRGPRLVPLEIHRRPLQPVPLPFRPPMAPPPHTILTLREQQVLQLSREMRHPGGVRLQLRRKDCSGSIALVDAFGAIWVAGWKQREHPTLYNALHIGDRLLSVAGLPVPNASEAHRIIRSAACLYVELIVRRVPFGRVLAIRREHEGQDLGLELESGTAEIRTVRSLSPAARAGLPPRAPTCDGLSLSNWVLTEVNSRPLNLFFKDNEVKDRLNAVGMDISILVQPFDLIKQIKKQLKSLRGYKDYLVQ